MAINHAALRSVCALAALLLSTNFSQGQETASRPGAEPQTGASAPLQWRRVVPRGHSAGFVQSPAEQTDVPDAAPAPAAAVAAAPPRRFVPRPGIPPSRFPVRQAQAEEAEVVLPDGQVPYDGMIIEEGEFSGGIGGEYYPGDYYPGHYDAAPGEIIYEEPTGYDVFDPGDMYWHDPHECTDCQNGAPAHPPHAFAAPDCDCEACQAHAGPHHLGLHHLGRHGGLRRHGHGHHRHGHHRHGHHRHGHHRRGKHARGEAAYGEPPSDEPQGDPWDGEPWVDRPNRAIVGLLAGTLPRHVEVFGGFHGFKGPRDLIPGTGAVNGNFGFQEGFNLAGPLGEGPNWDVGYQLGYQMVHSNLSGTVLDASQRDQFFVTGGVFRRTQCGLQFGAVWDWMRDEYYNNVDLNQVRGEISYRGPRGGEVGFLLAAGTNSDLAAPIQLLVPGIRFEATDQYLFFYRWHFRCDGEARVWGGLSGSTDAMFGGDATVPLNDSFALAISGNYLIPEEADGPPPGLFQTTGGGAVTEQWNLGINLVWYIDCRAKASRASKYRPLFNVADNGSFMMEVQ